MRGAMAAVWYGGCTRSYFLVKPMATNIVLGLGRALPTKHSRTQPNSTQPTVERAAEALGDPLRYDRQDQEQGLHVESHGTRRILPWVHAALDHRVEQREREQAQRHQSLEEESWYGVVDGTHGAVKRKCFDSEVGAD